MDRSALVWVLAIISMVTANVCFAVEPSFQRLGGLPDSGPDYTLSSAYAVSADGSTVVGDAYTVVSNVAHGWAFRWTAAGGMENLGTLPGNSQSKAYAVSGDGSMVVGGSDSEAFSWQNGSMTNLGTQTYSSTAYGISADGSVIVGYKVPQPGTGWGEAFRWENGTVTGLGTIAGTLSSARAVSTDGTVVVGSSGRQAFRWENNTMSGLGFLPDGSGGLSVARAVSSSGSVVVGVSSTTDDTHDDMEAFRWENGVMTGLGDLPGGDFYSLANDVSADGSVVVGYSTSSGSWPSNAIHEAFIWDNDNGMRNLREVLVNDFDLDLTGWILDEATGISANGNTIVGFGTNPDGVREGWVVTIPEPHLLSLLVVGGMISRHRKM